MNKLHLTILLCLSSVIVLKAQQTVVTTTTIVTPIIANDSTSFQDYCGIYKMAENPYIEEVKIELKDGKLISKTPEDEEVVFEHTENDEFFIPPFSARAIFIRENGIVKKVKVVLQGKELAGEKK
jgi:hypothetical protein